MGQVYEAPQTTGTAAGWSVHPFERFYVWKAWGPRGSERGSAADKASAQNAACDSLKRLTVR